MKAQDIRDLAQAAFNVFLSLEAGEQIVSAKQILQSFNGNLRVFPGAVAEVAIELPAIIKEMEKDLSIIVHPLCERGLTRAMEPVFDSDEARTCLPGPGKRKYAGIRIVTDPNDLLLKTWWEMCGIPGKAGVTRFIKKSINANNQNRMSDESVTKLAEALLDDITPEGLEDIIERVRRKKSIKLTENIENEDQSENVK
jgi:hypothetical protein